MKILEHWKMAPKNQIADLNLNNYRVGLAGILLGTNKAGVMEG
jgi:hypothetical protein